MSTAAAETRVNIAPFTIELGDDRNRQINIPLLHNTFRGRFSQLNLQGREIGQPMSGMPDIPGIHLTIDARKRKVTIHDPLTDNPKLCEQIKRVLSQGGSVQTHGKIVGVEDGTTDLDAHGMKTLVRFVVESLIDPKNGDPKARLVSGPLPERKDIDALPGEYLYDPGAETQHGPKFEKDAAEFFDRINRGG